MKTALRIAIGKLVRLVYRPALPKLPNGEIRLHLGCGKIDHPGFINIDAIPRRHVHYVQAVGRLGRFDNASVDLVYACHVLEHFSHLQVPAVLREWGRVIRPGGRLCLSVPDFDRILDIYRDTGRDAAVVMNALMGGQEYAYNYHRVIFNKEYLSGLLLAAGFSRVHEWAPDDGGVAHDVIDWSRRPFLVNGRAYPVSLNLEAER
ncbi:MAG TPA: methyltransferase domain-containing protein [Rhodocyclaceae bacterium]|nr:methyltransferase domain-containing protein [Rhodocyclaceae bacterium]